MKDTHRVRNERGVGGGRLLHLVVVLLMVDVCIGAVGGPCDATCTDKLNCCNDQNLGPTCFNTTTSDCTANVQICAKGLSLCGTQCYDGSYYDCMGSKLCPDGDQLCGTDQCFDTNTYACISGSQILRTKVAAECNGVGYNTQVNECVNGTLGPIRASTPCEPNQALCGTYCYDPTLYTCTEGQNLTAVPGFCGQGQVWCQIKCFDPHNYTCQVQGGLVDWKVGDPCPGSQQKCGQVCYDPSVGLVCTDQLVVCPTGLGVCNNTCYNTTRYDCVNNSITMHPGYCPTGLGLCGGRCYNGTVYTCNRDLLVPSDASVGCGSSPCLTGDSCCSDGVNKTVCYESAYYDCISNDIDPPQLCGKGLALCGTECYDSTVYSCNNQNTLCPTGLSYCPTNNQTGCYDSSKYTCLSSSTLCPTGGTQCSTACINIDKYICDLNNVIEYVVCPKGQLNCAGTCYVAGGKLQCVNHTLVEGDNTTCPSGNCNGTCFDLTRAYCVDGQVVPKPQCDDTQDLCFDTCYDPSTQVCLDDTVYVKCAVGLDRCNNTCYDSDTQTCLNGVVVNQTCAYKGLDDCGSVCYNTTSETCKDGIVYEKCLAGLLDCGKGCYDPNTQDCVGDVIYPKCPGTQERCGANCYNPATDYCDNGTIKPNSASLTTASLTLLLASLLCAILL